MNDMIDAILSYSKPDQEGQLRKAVSEHTHAVLSSAGCGNRDQVYEAEQAVRANPEAAFEFDATNSAILKTATGKWHAGRFETAAIGELKERALGQRVAGVAPQARLWVLEGASPVTDIGTLQATSGNGTLFQVASQFNCLESPGPHVTDVANYFTDPTQGPRASISAFPATLLRHYMAPGANGTRFVQTNGQQIDLLHDVCGRDLSRSGYFTGEDIADPQSVIESLETHFDKIRVGVHDDAEVVLGYDWDGTVKDSTPPRISQVFTSTVAGGAYRGETYFGEHGFPVACRHLLRAAYLGTLLTAACLGRKRVVLTLIGGGVFQNPIEVIWGAIEWALEEVRPFLSHDLDVIVNGRDLSSRISQDKILPAVRACGGAIFVFDHAGLKAVHR